MPLTKKKTAAGPKVTGDDDDPMMMASIASIKVEHVADMLQSKAFFNRSKHQTLLSSVEFHSVIKEHIT